MYPPSPRYVVAFCVVGTSFSHSSGSMSSSNHQPLAGASASASTASPPGNLGVNGSATSSGPMPTVSASQAAPRSQPGDSREAGRRRSGTGYLTARYLLALGVLGVLAFANYVILNAQIETNRSIAIIAANSSRQRSLLQRSALLAQKLVSSLNNEQLQAARAELIAAMGPLEETHHELIRADAEGNPPPEPVHDIYYEVPWLLDTEMRNYIAQVRALTKSSDEDLNWGNPHLRYVDEVALSGRMVEALDQVVAAYLRRSDEKIIYLHNLALWSLMSTLAVLGITGVVVFRPMVRRVHEEMASLEQLNDTLEQRVQERTAEAEQRSRALARSEALYRSLVDNLPLYVLRKDTAGRFTWVNENLCKLLGRPADEIIGKTDYDFYPPELAEKNRQGDLQVLERGEVVRDVEELVSPQGNELHAEILKTPVRDSGGEIVETQTIFLDVTARIEAERRLVQSERLAAIGQMVAGVAHESRNALQQIQACSGLLAWKLDGQAEATELLEDLQKALDRLRRLFDDLRGYAAPVTLDRRPGDVLDALRDAWKALATDRQGREARVVECPPTTDTRAVFDRLQMEQVFRNILENALAACDDPVEIEVSASQTELGGRPAVAVRIADGGPGLSPQQLQHIFEAFYTTKTKGTGLGMTIARRIMEAHRGCIQVESPPGEGAVVTVIVPREP